ncbi:MAG TPA: GNAT family N-acetyltransferase [Candidatus Saccharimonadales bacterium]|nr:GNAT family N-acetyltransferase [Candidatus Saccharimonadales bacterium]
MALEFEIVPAQPEDAARIGELRAGSWQQQYSDLPGIDPEWIAGKIARMTSDVGNDLRAEAIAQSVDPDAHGFWRVARLTEDDHDIIGFVDARKLDGNQELRSIHITDGLRGLGVGQALMDAAHDWFDDDTPVFLDVAQENRRAQAFYARSTNDYHPTDYTYTYEQLDMMRMQREARE